VSRRTEDDATALRVVGGAAVGPQPSGRERHDEKITVYLSSAELLELERARLELRAQHGMAVDRGRLVRAAMALALAELAAAGPASELLGRLRAT
jgi:hypothetical protein